MPPIVQVDSIAKSFGALPLFEDISFAIDRGQKIGLIAPNGAGKTTLLRIMAGEETPDGGSVIYQSDVRVGYLPQQQDFSQYPDILTAALAGIHPDLRSTIARYEHAVESREPTALQQALAEMDAKGAWSVEQELQALLSKLLISNPLATTSGLSGGESKRIAIASVLLGAPDLLILDEPTNHLDPDIVEWLEEYLSARALALLMVTHDRYVLDRVCDTILEIDSGTLYRYEGNYSTYLEKRAARMEQLAKEQQSIRNLYRRELEWMRSTPQARSSKAKYRIDAFEQTKAKIRQVAAPQGPDLESGSVYIGKKIFEAHEVSKRYGDKVILDRFHYTFARHDRVGIVGANGVGKTTLVRLILGLEAPDSGDIEVGETVRFGYFSQEPLHFDEHKTVLEAVQEKAEYIINKKGERTTASQLLTRFSFPPPRQHDYVAKLSGGERRRLQLCIVLMDNPNFLVLDEPTNDLDLPTLRVLEQYLADFDGCLLIVSHDRYFMDKLVSHLFVLKGDGTIADFPGNYSDLRKIRRQATGEDAASGHQKQSSTDQADSESDKQSDRKRDRRPKKLSYKESKEYEELPDAIAHMEEQLREMESSMSSGTLDPEQLQQVSLDYEQLRAKLDEQEMRWLELSERLDT